MASLNEILTKVKESKKNAPKRTGSKFVTLSKWDKGRTSAMLGLHVTSRRSR